MQSLKKVLYNTVHRRTGKTVETLADELGISPNYLYRACLPTEGNGSGCRFPLELLIPLMNATDDHSVLKHLAHRTGHAVFPVPAGRVRSAADLNDHQRTLADYFASLLKFFGGELDRDDCLEHLQRVLEQIAGFKRSIEEA